MNVLGIRWLGVPAERYGDIVAFFRDGLGLVVEFEKEEATTELSNFCAADGTCLRWSR